MEKVHDVTVHKLSFKYENETEKEIHIKLMIKDGWRLEHSGGLSTVFNTNPLKVTFVKSVSNMYPVARL